MPQPPSRLATVLTFLSSPETSYTLFIIFIFANAILLAFLFLMRKHRIVERKLPTLDAGLVTVEEADRLSANMSRALDDIRIAETFLQSSFPWYLSREGRRAMSNADESVEILIRQAEGFGR